MYLFYKHRTFSFLISWCLLAPIAWADRLKEYEDLKGEYDAAQERFYGSPIVAEPTPAERIRLYEAAPFWQFVPRFAALAEANPGDDTAYRCCMWILDLGVSDRETEKAHCSIWRILADHHAEGDKFPQLCFRTVQNIGRPAEDFLRGQLQRKDLTREETAYATLSLAELLAQRVAYLESMKAAPNLPKDEFMKFVDTRRSLDWDEALNVARLPQFKDESMRLFRIVLDKYGDVPNAISMPYFRDIGKLGDKAQKSLHALEHLTIGAEAPDIVGEDLNGDTLNLRDYRGRVVLLSFWFSGCGPCIAMVPEEQELVEKFKDHPFALLAVCADEDPEQGRAAAKEHGMHWPCWFDGDNGPIAQKYNVLSWPTFYLLDKNGRIAAKIIDREHMDITIEELLDSTSQ